MNTLISHKEFIKMRDQGKFSKKFKGKHYYFLYLDPEVEKKTLEVYINNDDYKSPPPAPRNRNNSFSDKYFVTP